MQKSPESSVWDAVGGRGAPALFSLLSCNDKAFWAASSLAWWLVCFCAHQPSISQSASVSARGSEWGRVALGWGT